MTDQHDVQRLEQRISELETEQEALRGQLARAQLDQWEGRIDDLEVQLHLATMDLDDRLAPLVDALRNRWLDAQQQFGASSSTTGDVLDTLRSGLEQAMKDIRTAIKDASSVATR